MIEVLPNRIALPQELELPKEEPSTVVKVTTPKADGSWGGEWGDVGRVEYPLFDAQGNKTPIQSTDLRAVPDWAHSTGINVHRILSLDLPLKAVEWYRGLDPKRRGSWSLGGKPSSHHAIEDLKAGKGLRSVVSNLKPPNPGTMLGWVRNRAR